MHLLFDPKDGRVYVEGHVKGFQPAKQPSRKEGEPAIDHEKIQKKLHPEHGHLRLVGFNGEGRRLYRFSSQEGKALSGARGLAGPAGPKGATGSTGKRGPSGKRGPAGKSKK